MKRALDALAGQTYDLLILGGGITGAGVALDAALRGLKVALIDKGDFAGGTSSISSKLVHGGLRYLEHGDLHLVYEALAERARLLRNAPHQAWPLRFVLPFYRGARVPSWKMRTGLFLYDLLALDGNIHRSRSIPLRSLQREFPGLRSRDLLGGAEYFDGQMDDARLCIEVVRTAALQGATPANYVEAVAFEKTAGRIIGVQARDLVAGQELTIRAHQVLNATGPWGDAIRRLAGDAGPPQLRPTKGVHLIAPGRGLTAAFLLLHPTDGRVFFVIPWLGKTLIGTTDTACDEPPEQLQATAEDVAYLLDGHNHYFTPPLHEAALLSSIVGLRPLLRGKRNDPSAMSREFALTESASGLLTVAGGKYTTFRAMAETITDAVVKRLGVHQPCRTRWFKLDGAPRGDWQQFLAGALKRLAIDYGLHLTTAMHLLRRYGRRAEEVAQLSREHSALGRPIVEGEPDLRAELVYQSEHEMALWPQDHLLRRTRLGLFRPEVFCCWQSLTGET
jgi:glycerol-3-phosphate dehydrogenase